MSAPLHILAFVLFLVGMPLLALWLERRHRLFEVLNPVVLCYGAGMVLANLLPFTVHEATAITATEAAIPLAIPLVLFSSNLPAWLRGRHGAVRSFLAALVAVMLTSAAAAVWLGHLVEQPATVSGMLVGVYTGGTPNLVSIGMALEAPEETFSLLNAADVVVGGLYLLALISVAKPMLRRFLPAYADDPGRPADEQADEPHAAATFDLRRAWRGMLAGLGLSALIVAASAGFSILVAGELWVPGIFLGITTGGIAASFAGRVRRLAGTYVLGNYFILIFCVAMGARTDFAALLASGGGILTYTAAVMFGAVLLHLLAAKLMRVDVDTWIITSTAAVYGPAFVPVVAESIDNRQVILSGLTAGLVGYAIGNYLGIGLAYLLS